MGVGAGPKCTMSS